MRDQNHTELKNTPSEELAETTSADDLPVELRKEGLYSVLNLQYLGLTYSLDPNSSLLKMKFCPFEPLAV